MKCVIHLEKDAVCVCNHCGKSICSDCQVEIKGENYCKDCLVIKVGNEKKEVRSPVLAAILSFVIAGLGQIYNGQIGKGILIFFTSLLIIPWIFGIVDAYQTAKKINEGKIISKSRPGCLIATIIGVAVLNITIIFLVFMLLAASIAIPNFLRAGLVANESGAEATLKNISAAIETYRLQNNGSYPQDESGLTSSARPYLKEPYNNRIIYGYKFSESFYADGYKVMAEPQECGSTGTRAFTIETGGALSSYDCQEE